MWRYLTLVLVAVVVTALVIVFANTFVLAHLDQRADEEIPKLVGKQQAMMPVRINEQIELTQVSYTNRMLHYEARSKIWFDHADAAAESIEQGLKTKYCKDMTAFVKAGVAVEFEIRIPPKTRKGDATNTRVRLHPGDCR